ncbi:predicted protein [Nematostella vectensis]|uniref:Uncharacterized protein n=1 Tax=Nematostella vectensis TaxID=45351 RepID=A7RWK3_NEMVE|nr:predicted protein [Nematostella vectensis]|eukprot:XP_001636243.1 predicted protein [Nematostella vectensis]
MATCSACVLRRVSPFIPRNKLFLAGILTRYTRKYNASHSFPVRCFSSGGVVFPWAQQLADVYGRSPFLHRLVGGLSLARSLRKVPDGNLDVKEFLYSAKDCILLCTRLMATLDCENKLENLLSKALYRNTQRALDQLKTSSSDNGDLRMHLEVEKIRNLSIAGIRSVVGPDDAGDDYVFAEFLGQQCIIPASEVEPMVNGIASFSMQHCRDIARAAFDEGFRFQIDVKFMTRERFFICRRLPNGLDDVLDETVIVIFTVIVICTLPMLRRILSSEEGMKETLELG